MPDFALYVAEERDGLYYATDDRLKSMMLLSSLRADTVVILKRIKPPAASAGAVVGRLAGAHTDAAQVAHRTLTCLIGAGPAAAGAASGGASSAGGHGEQLTVTQCSL